MDGLLRREWVKEDDLAADLKIHPRILRKALRWFEQVVLCTFTLALVLDIRAVHAKLEFRQLQLQLYMLQIERASPETILGAPYQQRALA